MSTRHLCSRASPSILPANSNLNLSITGRRSELPLEVVLDQGRLAVDLDGVLVHGCVLEQPVVGVEQLPGQEEEQLARRPAIVQSVPHDLTLAQMPLPFLVVETD